MTGERDPTAHLLDDDPFDSFATKPIQVVLGPGPAVTRIVAADEFH